MNGTNGLYDYRCTSGKTSWGTRSRAKKIGKIYGKKLGKVLRAYHCQICNAWHLFTKCKRRRPVSTATTRPLRMRRLEIENVLNVKALTIDAEGKNVIISGANGAGKSSAVNAIWGALKGFAVRDFPEPVHRGADKATVTLDLGEYLVTRHVTQKGTRLVVTAADGSRVGKPQELLDGLLGKFSLDPLAFLGMRPQDQVDAVLSLAGVSPPVRAVQELTGERHEPRPGESAETYLMRLSADEIGVYYHRRREAHRTLDQKRAALEEQRVQFGVLGGPLLPEDAELTPTETIQAIEDLRGQDDARRAALAQVEDLRRDQERSAQKLEELGVDERRLAADIKALDERLVQVRDARQAVLLRIAKGKQVVTDLAQELQSATGAAAALPDPAPRIAELRTRLATVDQANKTLSRRRAAAEQLQRLSVEAAQSQGEHDRQQKILAGLRELRAHLLDGVDLGVPGLAIGDGGLRLGGVPFQQAGQAEAIRVACAVAMHGNPKLKLLRVDEAERLDSTSMGMLLDLAEKHDFQVIAARVSDEKGLRVEILEGGE